MRFALASFAAIVIVAPALSVAAESSPIELIKKVADEVLGEIKRDSAYQTDKTKLQAMVHTRIAPYFDFTRLTQLAMGKHWNLATPDQKKTLTEQFARLLVRTYSNALVTYRNQEIEYLPFRGQPEDKKAEVRIRVHGAGKSPVNVDFTLVNTPSSGWKAYDVTVGGVSLVTNYRDEFNTVIGDKGVDGLISYLKDKNTQPVPAAPAKP
ncbi:MAG: ABC transporter substrate-binding protein [Pseudomonadota bacterium]